MTGMEWINGMSVKELSDLRDDLDSRRPWELPGAEKIGDVRAKAAYNLMRVLLTSRIENHQSQ